jgi:hypothetical protein
MREKIVFFGIAVLTITLLDYLKIQKRGILTLSVYRGYRLPIQANKLNPRIHVNVHLFLLELKLSIFL